MKSQANGKTVVALISIFFVMLAGCTTPYATATLKPFPDTEANAEIIEPEYPEIQKAVTIIDSVLIKNGYVTQADWINGSDTEKGWWITKTYRHRNPYVNVTVYNEGVKKPTTTLKAGKRSVKIHVVFQESNRWFSKMDSETEQVRDEVARELGTNFGSEKVTTAKGRIETPLQ